MVQKYFHYRQTEINIQILWGEIIVLSHKYLNFRFKFNFYLEFYGKLLSKCSSISK